MAGMIQARIGPSRSTERVRPRRGRWPGLSLADGALLSVWLSRDPPAYSALHTHVPVGAFPVEVADAEDEFTVRQVNALWPRRIDVALVVGSAWWIVECKPDADHHALGQVLAYRHWWLGQLPDLRLNRVVVLTDQCQSDCRPVFLEHGIELIELGHVLAHERRRAFTADARDFA